MCIRCSRCSKTHWKCRCIAILRWYLCVGFIFHAHSELNSEHIALILNQNCYTNQRYCAHWSTLSFGYQISDFRLRSVNVITRRLVDLSSEKKKFWKFHRLYTNSRSYSHSHSKKQKEYTRKLVSTTNRFSSLLWYENFCGRIETSAIVVVLVVVVYKYRCFSFTTCIHTQYTELRSSEPNTKTQWVNVRKKNNLNNNNNNSNGTKQSRKEKKITKLQRITICCKNTQIV